MKRGIHYGVSSTEYHAWTLDKSQMIDGPISCSEIKRFAESPYAWRFGPQQQTTDAMRAGSLFDAALTEPDKLETECVVNPFDSFRTKAAKEWRADNEGKLIVTAEQLERAKKAAQRVQEHDEAGSILAHCRTQVAVVGKVGEIPAKCLIDILPDEDTWDETIWDYKTTCGLRDEEIRRTIGKYRYHWQAAFYRTLWNQVSKDRHCERFGFIFQDRDTLEVRVVELASDDIALGSRSLSLHLQDFARCAHRGIRSRYATGRTELGQLPYQAMNEEEANESFFQNGKEAE